ncbi:hypothetical protein HYV31_00745 [candidate division WWE3 bacterium]|nr:hypothetical protein [candidate division WWE3 bacterium]
MLLSFGQNPKKLLGGIRFYVNSTPTFLTQNKREILKIGVLVLILLVTSFQKYKVFDEAGGDFEVYRKASRDFLSGKNPYKYTVDSYKNEKNQKRDDTTQAKKDDLGHGFAYLPGLLYVQTPLYVLSQEFNLPIQRVWRTPVLLVDIGVSVLLIISLYKRNYLATVLSLLLWSYSPFFLVRGSYTNTEPFPVFFLLFSLILLEKNNKLSALFFALSVAFKTFPIMFLPIFLLKSKDKFQFLLIGFLVFIFISLPFMKSFQDFWTYLQGALLVHGDRELQGRPILSYIQYYTGINFFQPTLFKFYVYLALLSGPFVVLLTAKRNLHKYIQVFITFLCFYIFTPVLSRTHLVWFIPFYILGMSELVCPTDYQLPKDSNDKPPLIQKFGFNKKWLWYYFAVICFYAFYAFYLLYWDRGFRYQENTILL